MTRQERRRAAAEVGGIFWTLATVYGGIMQGPPSWLLLVGVVSGWFLSRRAAQLMLGITSDELED